jgi:preprotein translocase subunit SecD
MLLGVKTEEAIVSKMKSLASSVKFFTETSDILTDEFFLDDEQIRFTILDEDDKAHLQAFLKDIKGLEVTQNDLSYTLQLSLQEQDEIKKLAVDQAVETIRNRLNQFGLAEPTVAKQGLDKILVELPGIKTAAEEQRARELIAKSAYLQLMAVDEARKSRVYTMSEAEAASYGDVILPDVADERMKHLVREIPIFDGSKLTDAHVAFNEMNQPIINFSLDSQGAKIFGDFTGANVGNHLAIVLDGKVFSAPVINERIGGGSGQISGGFTVQEAQDLAIALRSGALLAPVYMLEKRSVGPSLGADSVKASLIALIGGFLLVIVFMITYYGAAGIIANIALMANLFIILAVMASFGATLTLPGMAGIVLTVGMAVDANVIITERIRELIYQGVSAKKAIEDGYANAMRAILDANITTLIAAVLLYVYGSGPIKGFALTISIGILASMLTAIVGTHGIYDAFGHKITKANLPRWFGLKKA